jgi:hypothetical protein
MTNQHYFLVAGIQHADGSVSFVIDSDCDHFSTRRPIWNGEEWVSISKDNGGADADIKDALDEALSIRHNP